MESFMLKGFETKHLNITNNVSFETELPVDCSKVIWFTITAIFPSRPDGFHPASRACIKYYSMLKQASAPIPYGKFCIKRLWDCVSCQVAILNYMSFEAELYVDCSKSFWNIINAIFPSPKRVLLCILGMYWNTTVLMFKQASAPTPYGKFCIKRLWDHVSYHIKLYIIWSRITCRLQ